MESLKLEKYIESYDLHRCIHMDGTVDIDKYCKLLSEDRKQFKRKNNISKYIIF